MEQIGLQAAAHAGGCVEGVLAAAVFDAAAKRRLG
jgi:membrane associated rhomboid family serine protease